MGNVGGIGRGGRADFDYDHPEAADGGAAVSEGAGSEAAAIASSSRGRRPGGARPAIGVAGPRPLPEPPGPVSFAGFRAESIRFLRDGGTATFSGRLNRSQTADLRYDGKIGSPTRGEVFVKVKHFTGSTSSERPLTAEERKELAKSIEKQLRNPAPDDDPAALRLLLERIRAPRPSGGAGAPVVSFLEWNPQSVEVFRDGGTIRAEGPLSRYAHGAVRYDGRIGSATRGQIFVTVAERGSPPRPERPLSKDELSSLKSFLEQHLRANPDAHRGLEQLLEHVKAALSR